MKEMPLNELFYILSDPYRIKWIEHVFSYGQVRRADLLKIVPENKKPLTRYGGLQWHLDVLIKAHIFYKVKDVYGLTANFRLFYGRVKELIMSQEFGYTLPAIEERTENTQH